MTNYELTKETAPHVCESDLANMQQNIGEYADTWFCVVCAPQYGDLFVSRPRFGLHIIVEMLRERAVAQDAATRYLRGAKREPIQFQQVGAI